MKSFSRKTKSDFIFWGILIAFLLFLFLTPYGENTRSWLTSLALTSPSNSLNYNDTNIKINNDWSLISTDVKEIKLSELTNPIFVNIWATWCSPCRSELPSILELEEKYKGKIDFLLVSPNESIEKLKKFAKQKNYTSTFYSSNSAIPKGLFSNSYPTTYILDANKKLILKSVGAHDWNAENIHEILDKLIKEPASY